jgi:hypothetical protein
LPLFDVRELIAKNWHHLTVPILKLAEKLCSKDQELALQACNILHISRVVCLDSSNLEEFITRAHFMLENEGPIIPNHLKSMEKQPLMKIADFHTLVIKMTHTSPQIMKRLRPSLTPYPVCAWEKILCTLLDVDETTLSTEEPVSHWIVDL